MERRVYFIFDYQRDLFRVNKIRKIPHITTIAAAGFSSASLWKEAVKKGDTEVKRLISDALVGTTVTVVCIGSNTANRKYIDYEITESLRRGNGLVGVQIHHLRNRDGNVNPPGGVPPKIMEAGFKAYKYTHKDRLAELIQEAAILAKK